MPKKSPLYAQVVGEQVRMWRRLKKITLTDMAKAAGLSQSGWSRVETGDTTMTVEQLRIACKMLGVAPWTLLRHADRGEAFW